MCEVSKTTRRQLIGLLAVMLTCSAASAETGVSPPICAGGHLSKAAMNLFLARPVDEHTEVKQGEQLLGNAHTQGQITVGLTPTAGAVVIDVRLTGVSRLDKPAGRRQGKPTVESQIDAHKCIVVNENGLTARPATADCKASVKALNGLGLKKQSFAERLRQGAEKVASRQADARVRRKLDGEVDQAIDKATARLQRQPWLPIDKAALLFDMLAFCTTDEHACAEVVCDEGKQISVPQFARQLDPNYDLHLLVHEELVGAMATKWFSGQRISDRAMLSHVERMRGRAPWALWVHSRRPRWAVTLAEEAPFSVQFDENKMHLRWRIERTEWGGDTLETPIEVAVVVVPETTAEGHRLRRLVGPEITFADGQIDSQREQFAAMLQQKFEAFFPEAIYFDGLKTPSSGSWSKFLQFELADFSAEQGWFSVAFRLQGDSVVASGATGELQR